MAPLRSKHERFVGYRKGLLEITEELRHSLPAELFGRGARRVFLIGVI